MYNFVGLTLRLDGLGGLYFNTGLTIAGFQSRVGCLFFLVRVLVAVVYSDGDK